MRRLRKCSFHVGFFVSEIKTVFLFGCFALFRISCLFFLWRMFDRTKFLTFLPLVFFVHFSLLIAPYNHFTVNRMLPQSNQFVTLFWFHFSIEIAFENIKMSWRNKMSVLNFRFINSIINVCLYHRFTIFCWTFQFGFPCLGCATERTGAHLSVNISINESKRAYERVRRGDDCWMQ